MKASKHFIYPKSRILKAEELVSVYHALRRAFGHQHWWPGETPFEVVVGAILTQNTAWPNVEKAIVNLKAARKLSPGVLYKMPKRDLARFIRPAGYFNIKADRLKHFIRFLFDEYQGRLALMFGENGERLRKKLLGVKGIGPETADSILLYALKKPFFVIDAYTKRVFARHRLFSLEGRYAEWQKLFSDVLPKKVSLYNDFHAQIVAVGKTFCRTRPLCEKCPLRCYL
jgi:endonuclease-3 related protein